MRGVAADASLSHAGVDHVGVGIGYRDGADTAGFELPVGDWDPGIAAVRGLEDSAADAAEVVDIGLGRDAGDGYGTATAKGSDEAEAEGAEGVGWLCDNKNRQ